MNTTCYAKLVTSNNHIHYLNKPFTTLGRRSSAPANAAYTDGSPIARADIHLGQQKFISHIHALITYQYAACHTHSHYTITNLSKNAILVDGRPLTWTDRPLPLPSRTLISIGDVHLYFLLPRHADRATELCHLPIAQYNVPLTLLALSASYDDDHTNTHPSTADAAMIQAANGDFAFKSSLPGMLAAHQSGLVCWSKSEKERLRDGVLQFGISRRHRLLHFMKTTATTDKTPLTLPLIQHWTHHIVAALITICGGVVGKQLRHVCPAAHALVSTATFDPTLINSLTEWRIFVKNAKSYGYRIVQLQQLCFTLLLHSRDHLLRGVENVKGRLPSPWWRPAIHDTDLLVGIFRYGYGNFDAYKTDPTLNFRSAWLSWQAHPEFAQETNDNASANGGGDDSDDDDEDDEDDDDGGADGDEMDDGGEKRKKKKQKKSRTSLGSASLGISKGIGADGWPINLAIVGRFRQVLKAIKARDAAAERRRQTSGTTTSSSAADKSETRNVITRYPVFDASGVRVWGVYDTFVFYRALLIYGVPLPRISGDSEWSGLREFVTELNEWNDATISRVFDAAVQNINVTLTDINMNEVDELLVLREDDKDILDDFDLDEPNVGAMSPLLATRLRQRIETFQMLRHTILSSHNITKTRSLVTSVPLNPLHQPLPSWYRPAVHDRPLIEAIARYGLSLERINADYAYPFKSVGGLQESVKVSIIQRWKHVVDSIAKQLPNNTNATAQSSAPPQEQAVVSASTGNSSSQIDAAVAAAAAARRERDRARRQRAKAALNQSTTPASASATTLNINTTPNSSPSHSGGNVSPTSGLEVEVGVFIIGCC